MNWGPLSLVRPPRLGPGRATTLRVHFGELFARPSSPARGDSGPTQAVGLDAGDSRPPRSVGQARASKGPGSVCGDRPPPAVSASPLAARRCNRSGRQQRPSARPQRKKRRYRRRRPRGNGRCTTLTPGFDRQRCQWRDATVNPCRWEPYVNLSGSRPGWAGQPGLPTAVGQRRSGLTTEARSAARPGWKWGAMSFSVS